MLCTSGPVCDFDVKVIDEYEDTHGRTFWLCNAESLLASPTNLNSASPESTRQRKTTVTPPTLTATNPPQITYYLLNHLPLAKGKLIRQSSTTRATSTYSPFTSSATASLRHHLIILVKKLNVGTCQMVFPGVKFLQRHYQSPEYKSYPPKAP